MFSIKTHHVGFASYLMGCVMTENASSGSTASNVGTDRLGHHHNNICPTPEVFTKSGAKLSISLLLTEVVCLHLQFYYSSLSLRA